MTRTEHTKQQRLLRAAILLVGTFTLLAFLFADPLLRGMRKRDQIGAIPRQDRATVALLIPARLQTVGTPEPAVVSVRFQGGVYTAKQALDADEMHVGDTVQITYRIGRSGHVYVDSAAPLPGK